MLPCRSERCDLDPRDHGLRDFRSGSCQTHIPLYLVQGVKSSSKLNKGVLSEGKYPEYRDTVHIIPD